MLEELERRNYAPSTIRITSSLSSTSLGTSILHPTFSARNISASIQAAVSRT
jgi:hypothetical protein